MILPLLPLIAAGGTIEVVDSDFDLASVRRSAATGCDQGNSDEIVVCGRSGASPYRLSDSDLDLLGRAKPTTRQRFFGEMRDVGEFGTGSCSAVGPGGWTGCMVKGWRANREQTAWGNYR